ncbi:MAG UNVERIFIED_CONTAM: hypothetical protein LVR18_46655 [Planctomycetaceae bacterium]
MVDRIILFLLGLWQRQQRTFKPKCVRLPTELPGILTGICIEIERCIVVQVVTADVELDCGSTLATGREDISWRWAHQPVLCRAAASRAARSTDRQHRLRQSF